MLGLIRKADELKQDEIEVASDEIVQLRVRIAALEAEVACCITSGNDAREQALGYVYELNAAAKRIAALEAAGNLVVEWWLTEGMKVMNGAPYSMFKLRAVLGDKQ
jgi:hypothetical protein